MVAKLFTKPFGVAGDKTPIPNDTQVDGTVSYQTGFGADYERQLGVDPAAKNIGRQTFNELMFDTTTALQEMQAGFGASVYSLPLAQALPGGGYPKGALIPRLAGNGFWLCTVAANISNPDTGGAGWVQAAMAQGSFYAIDTGVANAYSCAFSPSLVVRSEVQPLAVRIKFTNTGSSTINDGLGTVPLVGLAQAALQGGEVVANGVALLQWVAAIASYVVVYATGGAAQVVNATKSLQAVNANQIRSQSVTAFTTTGTATAQVLTPIPAITAYAALQRFNVTFNVASGLNPTINVSGQGVKFLKQYDSSGAKVAAVFAVNHNSDIVYDGTDWVLLNQLPVTAAQRKQSFRGLSKNLKVSANGISASVQVTADNVIVENSAGDARAVGSVSLTLDTAAVASASVDGMASGVTAADTWYAVYAWYSTSLNRIRITGDVSFTAPTAPTAAFDSWALIGVFRTDSTGSKFPLGFTQVGARWRYVVKADTNLTAPRLIARGSTGAINPTTQLAINLVVCPGALVVSVGLTAQNGTAAVVSTANNGGAWNSLTSPTPLAAGAQATTFAVTIPYDLVLEQPNAIFWGANGAGASLIINGFEVPQ